MLIRRRAPSLVLPDAPGQEELPQFWTLSSRDREDVMRAVEMQTGVVSPSGSVRYGPMPASCRQQRLPPSPLRIILPDGWASPLVLFGQALGAWQPKPSSSSVSATTWAGDPLTSRPERV